MNPTVAKHAVTFAFGTGVTLLIGLMIRAEHHVNEKIEAHYDEKKTKQTDK